jgi:hypothetical protein
MYELLRRCESLAWLARAAEAFLNSDWRYAALTMFLGWEYIAAA